MSFTLKNTASRKILTKGEKFARGSACPANIQLRTESLIGFSKFIYAALSPLFAGFPKIYIFLGTVLHPLQKSKILAKIALFSLHFAGSSVPHQKWYISINSGFRGFSIELLPCQPKGNFCLICELFASNK